MIIVTTEDSLVRFLERFAPQALAICGQETNRAAEKLLSVRRPPSSRRGEPPHTSRTPAQPIVTEEPQLALDEWSAMAGVAREYSILAWHNAHGRPWVVPAMQAAADPIISRLDHHANG